MLRQIPGELTPATVRAGIPKTKGAVFFRDANQTYDCGKLTWPGTTACGSGLMFTKITADKKKELLPDQPVDVSSVRPPG